MKHEIRQTLLRQRQALDPQDWQARSEQLCHHLQAWIPFQKARGVLAYGSFRQEPDLSSLWPLGKGWGLPRCVGRDLVWHQWQLGDPLEVGAYGILTPSPQAPIVDPATVDLILVPGVAYDRRGYRLGYGGGFYDRLLSQPPWHQIPTLGIGFAFGLLEVLPVDPWDQPLGGVCTEEGIWVTGSS